jgi:ADP-glucose pyrophosphorylase
MYTLRVVAVAAGAWAFAIAAVVFGGSHPVVNFTLAVAVTASVWVISRYTATKLKNEIVSELHSDVHQMPPKR